MLGVFYNVSTPYGVTCCLDSTDDKVINVDDEINSVIQHVHNRRSLVTVFDDEELWGNIRRG